MKRISLFFGARPEAIELCPLITELRWHPERHAHICITAQHREMLDQVLEVLEVDVDLDLTERDQRLISLTSRAITALDAYLTHILKFSNFAFGLVRSFELAVESLMTLVAKCAASADLSCVLQNSWKWTQKSIHALKS